MKTEPQLNRSVVLLATLLMTSLSSLVCPRLLGEDAPLSTKNSPNPTAIHVSKECFDSINRLLSIDLDKARAAQFNFSTENSLNWNLSLDSVVLENFHGTEDCEQFALWLRNLLFETYQKRLLKLLKEERLQEFFTETLNLVQTRDSPQRQLLDKDFLNKIESKYLRKISKRLMQRLIGSPWENYNLLQFSVVLWTAEWSALLKREAPAAVHYASQRIALRPLEYDPLSLEIFLFHEISHYNDPSRDKPLWTELQGELHAWQQTVDYLQYLKPIVGQIPPLFKDIQEAVQKRGLEPWVIDTFKSRNKDDLDRIIYSEEVPQSH